VNAIPYVAMQKGLLTVAKENKKNVFSGRIMEIEGLPDLKVEQAFELTMLVLNALVRVARLS
jgi:aconitate hydratase 2/2-methylisocitrate dehydratase